MDSAGGLSSPYPLVALPPRKSPAGAHELYYKLMLIATDGQRADK